MHLPKMLLVELGRGRTDEELLPPGEAESFPSEPYSSQRSYRFRGHGS